MSHLSEQASATYRTFFLSLAYIDIYSAYVMYLFLYVFQATKFMVKKLQQHVFSSELD